MFKKISKKILISLLLWICFWLGIFISYAVNNLSDPLISWETLTHTWFNDLRLRVVNIYSTSSWGNVGIWVTNPNQKLDVNWNVGINWWLNIGYGAALPPLGWIIISGNVWIWTAIPQAKLDIAWGIRFGNDSNPCTWANAWTTRYNSISKTLELCDWSTWSSKISSGWTLPACANWESLEMVSWSWICKKASLLWKEKINLADFRTSMTVTWFGSDLTNLYDDNSYSYILKTASAIAYAKPACGWEWPWVTAAQAAVWSIVLDMWSDYSTKFWNFIISWTLTVTGWTSTIRHFDHVPWVYCNETTSTQACTSSTIKIFDSVDNTNWFERSKATAYNYPTSSNNNNFSLMWNISWRYIKIEITRWRSACTILSQVDIKLNDLQLFYQLF